jgi:antitoxin component YwqK of YwqJK toxin-antitoxin module
MSRRALVVAVLLLVAACSDPDTARLKETTKPTYDKKTGKLTQLTYDRNKNGTIDTWTDMDGARPVQSRIDLDEDGKIDRWEYYDEQGKLARVGFSRKKDGKADAWAYPGPDGKIARIEISSTSDEKKIDRWEHYDASKAGNDPNNPGALVSADEDTNADGKPDKWETYENGAIKSVAFDENGDGKPDRRLTYENGQLVTIESEPDATGKFTKKIDVK